jgi:hypothetical protein
MLASKNCCRYTSPYPVCAAEAVDKGGSFFHRLFVDGDFDVGEFGRYVCSLAIQSLERFSCFFDLSYSDNVPRRLGSEKKPGGKEGGKEKLDGKRASVSPPVRPFAESFDNRIGDELAESNPKVDSCCRDTTKNDWRDLRAHERAESEVEA